MGGLCFRQKLGIEGFRFDNQKYFDFADSTLLKLQNLFKQYHLVRAYKTKSSHGDQDWIVSDLIDTKKPLKIQLLEVFDVDEVNLNQNSNVYSLLIDGFQLDISVCPPKYFDTASFYMDDSPAGNAIGKLYHKFGASYGYDGLYFTLRDNENTYKVGTIEISLDNKKICEFLGLDYQQKVFGFENETDIFNWISNSKFFDHRIFGWDAMNHRARIRDKKRPDYRRLMEFFDKNFSGKTYDFPLKSDGIEILDDFFPESRLVEKIQELREESARNRELAAKFNGFLVRSWIPGLEGKNLGAALAGFKSFVTEFFYKKLTFSEYLELRDAAEIKSDFLAWFSESKVFNVSEINS